MEQANAPISIESGELNALELAKDRVPMKWVASFAARVRGDTPTARNFKKGNYHFFSGKPEGKFEMIKSLIAQGGVTIRAACAAFGVSESGFYAHRHKALRSRRQQDQHES